ncbi:hypothetical protein TNCV_3028351 [Trichonephila clavipes]|nr:hypothetical protein TNCV_3028351 [Trichonephila clavipes]
MGAPQIGRKPGLVTHFRPSSRSSTLPQTRGSSAVENRMQNNVKRKNDFFINVALCLNTRLSGDGSRNFAPFHGQVTRKIPELSPPSRNYYSNGRTFQLSTDLMCFTPLHGRSSAVLGSNS